jgi:hypothetical protein
MAYNLFTPRHSAAGYLEKFFEGHDHARLSWLHEIGGGQWGHAADTLMSMAEAPSAAVDEDMEGQVASEQRLSCVQVSLSMIRGGPPELLNLSTHSLCSASANSVNLRKRLNRTLIVSPTIRSSVRSFCGCPMLNCLIERSQPMTINLSSSR